MFGRLIRSWVFSIRLHQLTPTALFRRHLDGVIHLLLSLGVLAFWIIFSVSQAKAQNQSYWLEHGSKIVISCPGARDGRALQAANGDNQWVYITAVVSCRDVGDAYSYSIDHIRVEINPNARGRIVRPVLNFDWIGLAVYAPQANGQTIHWLYDEGLPLRGSLEKKSREKIYFGNLEFPNISKSDIAKASNFTLYLTSQGLPYIFGLL